MSYGWFIDKVLDSDEKILSTARVDEVEYYDEYSVLDVKPSKEPSRIDRNVDLVLTNKKLYMVSYGYSVRLRSMGTLIEEHRREGVFSGFAGLIRGIKYLDIRSIAKANYSRSRGASTRFSIIVAEKKRESGLLAIGIFLLLMGFIVMAVNVVAGSFIVFISLILIAIYFSKPGGRSVSGREGPVEMEEFSELNILVKPIEAVEINVASNGGERKLVVKEGYAIVFRARNENSSELEKLAIELIKLVKNNDLVYP